MRRFVLQIFKILKLYDFEIEIFYWAIYFKETLKFRKELLLTVI